MSIDLHTHSERSDGTQPPADVVAAAAEAGLAGLALTDHDTVAGWDAARQAAEATGLGLVPGMEVSCRWEGISVHLLAYLVDPRDEALFAAIDVARRSREGRCERMVERLADGGYPITLDAVRRFVGEGAAVGRPHIADALVAAGAFATRADAFAGPLDRGSEFYVAYEAVDPVEACRLVRAAGGVPVIAHAFARKRGEVVPDSVIEDMARAGLAGIEARHRDQTPEQRAHAEALAADLHLLVTGGSDYHGAGKPNRIGENRTDPETVLALLAQGTGAPATEPRGGWSRG